MGFASRALAWIYRESRNVIRGSCNVEPVSRLERYAVCVARKVPRVSWNMSIMRGSRDRLGWDLSNKHYYWKQSRFSPCQSSNFLSILYLLYYSVLSTFFQKFPVLKNMKTLNLLKSGHLHVNHLLAFTMLQSCTFLPRFKRWIEIDFVTHIFKVYNSIKALHLMKSLKFSLVIFILNSLGTIM